MNNITISKETISNADAYIGLGEKIKTVSEIASQCISKVEIKAEEEGLNLPMMPMYIENVAVKSRYLMGILVSKYFKQEVEFVKDQPLLMSQDDYDRYAGSYIFNQIERLKSESSIRNKCFDLLVDYKDFEKRLNTEIYSYIQIMNDPVTRILGTLQIQSTPESMEAAVQQVKQLQSELEKYKENRKDMASE